jgi:hypothetical protein
MPVFTGCATVPENEVPMGTEARGTDSFLGSHDMIQGPR